MLAGVVWIASGIIDMVLMEGQGGASLQEVLFIVALVGVLGGLGGLHARQTPRYGWLGMAGFLAAFISSTLLLIGLVLTFVLSSNVLDPILALGLLGALVGLVLLGAATLRVGVLPRWCGLVLILCLPVAIALGDYGGGIVLGLVWLVVGYILLLQRDVSAMVGGGSENQ
jgi:hypothetical protein